MTKSRLNSRVAAIDIGSNALRIQFFERDKASRIRIAKTLRRPVRLGRDVFHNGRILELTFKSALSAMKEFRKWIDEYRVSQVAAVATSAVREAANGAEFVRRVARETKIKVQVIGGAEEARLIIAAVLERMDLRDQNAVHIEVGGGSVEVSLIENANIQATMTHKLGAVRLMELLNSPSYNEKAFRKIVREYVSVTRKKLKNSLGKNKIDRFIATGGNIDSLIWLIGRTRWGKIKMDNGVPKISYATLVKVLRKLSLYSFQERVDKLQVRPDRADVIIPAGIVYASFAEMAKAGWIYAPGAGVREGLALELFRREEKSHQEEKHKQLISSAKALGRKYGFDQTHAEDVTSYALQLFDALKKVHGLGKWERVLLEAASLLHDIGYFVEIAHHHKHTFYLISESDIVGLSPHDRLLVANIARYHRKALPNAGHEPFSSLTPKDKKLVSELASLLRIADALDREHAPHKRPLKIRVRKNKLTLGLKSAQDLRLERWALASKSDLFAKTFRRKVEIN